MKFVNQEMSLVDHTTTQLGNLVCDASELKRIHYENHQHVLLALKTYTQIKSSTNQEVILFK